MKDQLILAIGRENGTGGHAIAKALSEKLDIPIYDTAAISDMLQKKGFDFQDVNSWDKKRIKVFAAKREDNFSTPSEQVVATLTFEFLATEAAAGHSFIVIGRAADYVLANCENMVSYFLHADWDYRVNHIMEALGIDEKEAVKEIKAVDKQRRQYHDFYADTKWANAETYDLCINTTNMTTEQLADTILAYAKVKVPSAFAE